MVKLPNELRLGQFRGTRAMVTSRQTNDWRYGGGHLNVKIANGLFVCLIREKPSGIREVVYDCQQSYRLELVLEPPLGTPEHDQYAKWVRRGPGRAFFNSVEGLRQGHAFISPPLPWADGPTGTTPPKIGGSGYVSYGTGLLIVEPTYLGHCIYDSLQKLGVQGADLRTLSTLIIAELANASRRHGF